MPVWSEMSRKKPVRDVVAPVPKSNFVGAQALLPDDEADFLEIEGRKPVRGISADWTDELVKPDGVLCSYAPLHYDSANADGGAPWGPAAQGSIVVCVRGDIEFEDMARFAHDSGAVGLVIVDGDGPWEEDWEMTADAPGKPLPQVPAVLVPRGLREHLCGNSPELRARLFRKGDPIMESYEEASATVAQFMRMRGMGANPVELARSRPGSRSASPAPRRPRP